MNDVIAPHSYPPLGKNPPKRKRSHLRIEIEAAKTVVYSALAKGHSQAEAARLAGVSAVTVGKWVAKARTSGQDMSRERMLNMLSMRLDSEVTPPQYVTPMASLLADLQGWKTRKDERVVLKPMSELFDAWRDEQTKDNGARLTDRTLSDVESTQVDTVSGAIDTASGESKAPGGAPQ